MEGNDVTIRDVIIPVQILSKNCEEDIDGKIFNLNELDLALFNLFIETGKFEDFGKPEVNSNNVENASIMDVVEPGVIYRGLPNSGNPVIRSKGAITVLDNTVDDEYSMINNPLRYFNHIISESQLEGIRYQIVFIILKYDFSTRKIVKDNNFRKFIFDSLRMRLDIFLRVSDGNKITFPVEELISDEYITNSMFIKHENFATKKYDDYLRLNLKCNSYQSSKYEREGINLTNIEQMLEKEHPQYITPKAKALAKKVVHDLYSVYYVIPISIPFLSEIDDDMIKQDISEEMTLSASNIQGLNENKTFTMSILVSNDGLIYKFILPRLFDVIKDSITNIDWSNEARYEFKFFIVSASMPNNKIDIEKIYLSEAIIPNDIAIVEDNKSHYIMFKSATVLELRKENLVDGFKQGLAELIEKYESKKSYKEN